MSFHDVVTSIPLSRNTSSSMVMRQLMLRISTSCPIANTWHCECAYDSVGVIIDDEDIPVIIGIIIVAGASSVPSVAGIAGGDSVCING